MTKRNHGEGTVYRDTARRRWVAEFTLDGKRRRVTASSKTDALAKMRARMSEVESGSEVENRNVRVSDVMERFISRTLPNRKGGSLAPATLALHRWACGKIVEGLGTKRVSTLTVRDVEKFLDSLVEDAETPLAHRSLKQIRTTLRMALDESVKRREVSTNVARLADLHPAAQRTVRTQVPLDREMVLRFLEVLPSHRLGAMWHVMVRSGLRWEEAAGLHWDSIEGEVLHVRHAVRRNRGRSELASQMKNEHSRRRLALPSDVLEALQEHRRRQAEERLAAPHWLREELIFTSRTGNVLDYRHSARELEQFCAENDITVEDTAGPRSPRLHELRHTAQEMMKRHGTPLELISQVMGHSDVRMLQTSYYHAPDTPVGVLVESDWLTASA